MKQEKKFVTSWENPIRRPEIWSQLKLKAVDEHCRNVGLWILYNNPPINSIIKIERWVNNNVQEVSNPTAKHELVTLINFT